VFESTGPLRREPSYRSPSKHSIPRILCTAINAPGVRNTNCEKIKKIDDGSGVGVSGFLVW
jgi:hypothetical protein